MNKIITEAKEAMDNTKAYIDVFKSKNKNLIEEEKESYDKEEKRALIEEDNRLNGKMNYCLDIMKDITVAKTKILQLKK